MRSERTISGFPAAVQRDVDSLKRALTGRADPAAFLRVTRWLEEHALNQIQAPSWQTITALAPDTVRQEFLNLDDYDVATTLELPDDRKVTPAQYIRCFLDHRLPHVMEDWQVSSLFAPLYLQTSRRSTCILVPDLRGDAFVGLTIEWWGPYRSFRQFRDMLVQSGWFLERDLKDRRLLGRRIRKLLGGASRPGQARSHSS